MTSRCDNEPALQRPPTMPTLTIIAAVARNGVIGRGNALPWHLPEDLQHFKRHTLGRSIVMGRRTWDAIGRPLPGRRNIVITRQPQWHADGAERADSLAAALTMTRDETEVCVIGGSAIFAEALHRADRLLLTEIDADFDGDSFFPPWPREAFETHLRERHVSAQGWAYDFVEYRAREAAS